MATKWWTKVTGMALTGALVFAVTSMALAAAPDTGSGLTATPTAGSSDKANKEITPEMRAKHDQLKHLREEIKQTHERIVAERQELKGKAQQIKALMKDLKGDKVKNREALEKAKVDLRDMKLLQGDRKALDAKLQTTRQELKDAVKGKDFDRAATLAGHALSLMHSKLDILKAMNAKASQAITHLTATGGGTN